MCRITRDSPRVFCINGEGGGKTKRVSNQGKTRRVSNPLTQTTMRFGSHIRALPAPGASAFSAVPAPLVCIPTGAGKWGAETGGENLNLWCVNVEKIKTETHARTRTCEKYDWQFRRLKKDKMKHIKKP